MTPNDLGIFIIFHLVVYILAQLDQNWLRWHHWLHLVVHHYQLVVDQDWFPWHLWQGSGIVLTHDLILEIEMKLCLIPSFSRVLKIKHDCFPRIELGFWRRIRFIDSRVIKWTIWLPIVRYTEFNIDYRLEQKYHFFPTNQEPVDRWLTSKVSFGIIEFFVKWWWTILFEGTSKYKLSLMFNPLYLKILPDTNPSNVPNFQNVDKTCQYCYSIFIIEENRFFSRTRNETIDFVWTWCFGTDKNFWYNKSKI